MSNSDLGVIFYGSGDGSGSYVGPDGNPGLVRTLTDAHWLAGPWIQAGRFADLFLTISAVVSAQMTSFAVTLERRRSDTRNALFHPALIATARLDDPAAGRATQQTITRAQLVGQTMSAWPNVAPAIETLDVVLATVDQRWAGECRVLVKTTGVPLAGDRVVIAACGGG